MVWDNHLTCEASYFHGWVVFAVTSHIATMNIVVRHVLDIDAHIVPKKSFTEASTCNFNMQLQHAFQQTLLQL